MKLLVCLVYYDRPNLVRNALESIRALESDDWELAVIDDGGEPVLPIVTEALPGVEFGYVRIGDTEEQKRAQGGSRHGEFLNAAILDTGCEVAMCLCDDDAMVPDGVGKLLEWWEENPDAWYCWSYCVPFDPTREKPHPDLPIEMVGLNRHSGPIDCSCMADSSQVAFKTECFKTGGVRYASPSTLALDADLFEQLASYGPAEQTGFAVQYKAVFADQMGNRPGDPYKASVR